MGGVASGTATGSGDLHIPLPSDVAAKVQELIGRTHSLPSKQKRADVDLQDIADAGMMLVQNAAPNAALWQLAGIDAMPPRANDQQLLAIQQQVERVALGVGGLAVYYGTSLAVAIARECFWLAYEQLSLMVNVNLDNIIPESDVDYDDPQCPAGAPTGKDTVSQPVDPKSKRERAHTFIIGSLFGPHLRWGIWSECCL